MTTTTPKFEIDRYELNDLLAPLFTGPDFDEGGYDQILDGLAHDVANLIEAAVEGARERASLPDWDDHFVAEPWPDTTDTVSPQFFYRPKDESHLWTVLDCDGILYIATGWHSVNRVGYVMSTKPWTDEDSTHDWVW